MGTLLSLVPLSGACLGCGNEEWDSWGALQRGFLEAPGRGLTPRLDREDPAAPNFGQSFFFSSTRLGKLCPAGFSRIRDQF